MSLQEPEVDQEHEVDQSITTQQLGTEVSQELEVDQSTTTQQLVIEVGQGPILVTNLLIIPVHHGLMTITTHHLIIAAMPTPEAINISTLINHFLFAIIKNAQTGDRTPDLRVISTTL